MDLSVVVPTLNGREQLASCLDSLAEHAPSAEVVVVNGPSSDGTSGMVRDRNDVDVLVEISDRNRNVARNAGINAASGDAVGLVSYDTVVEPGWGDAVRDGLDGTSAAVTGPTHRAMRVGMTTETEETRQIAGRSVTLFNGDNVAFTREAVEAIDGFDEYLETGGARDASHRLAKLGGTVEWNGDMCVRGEFETDGGRVERDWDWKYRAFSYRLLKTYGLRPGVARRVFGGALADCRSSTRDLIAGDAEPSGWFGSLQGTVTGVVRGTWDGLAARVRDRRPCRNPSGLSGRYDRAVRTYDWR